MYSKNEYMVYFYRFNLSIILFNKYLSSLFSSYNLSIAANAMIDNLG